MMLAWALTVKLLSGECKNPHKWEIHIGSDNGLVLLGGNMPLSEPMLAQISVNIRYN